MGMIVKLPARRHGRASAGSRAAGARAARRTRASAVRPAADAVGVAKSADHHSSGIRSLWSHLRTFATGAPISDANAAGDRQSAITDRNEWKGDVFDVGVIAESALGQFVPDRKSILSNDCGHSGSQTCPMDKAEKQAVSAHRDAFAARVKLARMSRFETQQALCDVLDISQSKYKWYETSRYLPPHMYRRFAMACGVSVEWLTTGYGKAPVPLPLAEDTKPAKARKRLKKRAA